MTESLTENRRKTSGAVDAIRGIIFGYLCSLVLFLVADAVLEIPIDLRITLYIIFVIFGVAILAVSALIYLRGPDELSNDLLKVMSVMGFPGMAAVTAAAAASAASGATREKTLRQDIEALREEFRAFSRASNAGDIPAIIRSASDLVVESATQQLIENVERRLDSLTALYRAREALKPFYGTLARMNDEVARLNRQNSLNLSIGFAIAIIGVSLLAVFVFIDRSVNATPAGYAMHYLPRLSIVILVQIFALFFLRLYRVGLDEIKFAQNEMTNVEQRLGALSVALNEDDSSVRSEILREIARTDRNTRLEKGQSTIGLERARIEAQGGAAEILKGILPALVKK